MLNTYNFTFNTYNFTYKRDDGSVFNLLDCATGIKSFSIIQLLLKSGRIKGRSGSVAAY